MSYSQCGHQPSRGDTQINGSYTEFQVGPCQSEIRADITVTEFSTVRVWGQVKNSCGQPVPGVLLKLVRMARDGEGRPGYRGIAHTVSDSGGFYQFDVCAKDTGACYRILASKSALGAERVIPPSEPWDCRPEPSDCRQPCCHRRCREHMEPQMCSSCSCVACAQPCSVAF